MVTAKRGQKRRKLYKRELYFVFTKGQVNERTQTLKKGAIIHIARKRIQSDEMIVACGRDLGATYQVPFNHWLYNLGRICNQCKTAVGDVEASEKLFY